MIKVCFALSVLAVGVGEVNSLLDGLNAWAELGIKVTGLAAFSGAAWKWFAGPGARKVKAGFLWTRDQLGLIGQLDERLEAIEVRLDQGQEHFARIDESLGVMSDDHVREARAAIKEERPVRLTEAGGVERRGCE